VQRLRASCPVVALNVLPTSQMSVADTADRAWLVDGVKLGSGSVTALHVVPFQCSISPPEAPVPAAHASVLVRAEAPSSDTLFPVDGMVTAVHPGAAIAGAAITSAPVSAAAPRPFRSSKHHLSQPS
jgi:hypothetical protein